MARTAWSYHSRLAFFDQDIGQIAELPTQSDMLGGTAAA
jgi:hypothetical protein